MTEVDNSDPTAVTVHGMDALPRLQAKNIVICSDGTGNSAVKGRGTNVFKVFEAVDVNSYREDPSTPRQVAFYDDGVGTEKLKALRAAGGAFGWGLGRNVCQLYAAICRTYRPGDKIYLFGFSRGAFTVRTLAGLLDDCGVVRDDTWQTDDELDRLVAKAYSAHRARYAGVLNKLWRMVTRRPHGEAASRQFRADHSLTEDPNIRFLGVWDTVDAVGAPIPGVAAALNWVFRFKFSIQELPGCVEQACQALAIDEERTTFFPELWKETDDGRSEQVWFAGVHSNVGGGYPRQGLSLEALDWMMTRAEAADLHFVNEARRLYRHDRNPDDKLYDSRSGLAVYYRYRPRRIGRWCRDKDVEPQVHISAIRRIVRGTDGYAPPSLPTNFSIVSTDPSRRGEDAASLAEVARKLASDSASTEIADTRKSARRWVLLRQAAQYLFYFLTASAVVWAVSPESAPLKPWHVVVDRFLGLPLKLPFFEWLGPKVAYFFGWLPKLAGMLPFGDWLSKNLAQPLVDNPETLMAFLGSFLVCYYLGLLGRSRIERLYSRLWRERCQSWRQLGDLK